MTKFSKPAIALSALLAWPGIAMAQDLVFPVDKGEFDWKSYHDFAEKYDFSGQTLTIMGANTGNDADRYRNLYAYFAAATGATVQYSGSESYEQDIVIASKAGGLPDIANFPQPGLAKDMGKAGVLVPLEASTEQEVKDGYAAGQSWADLATFPGPDGKDNFYGVFFGTDVKSLVWYSPENFKEMGYKVPQTQEDLVRLSDQMVKDGVAPWCIGLGSGAATGWPATDWVEDFMLRTVPPKVYDEWVNHEIPFNDPRVVQAIEDYGTFVRNPKYTPGGPDTAVTTDFRDAPSGLFTFPPKCMMMKQASFIPTFFPSDVKVGRDASFFYFPPYASKPDLGRPVLGSGGMVTITHDSPMARAYIQFLLTPIAHEIMMAQGQFLTPLKAANEALYKDDTQRKLGDILTSATTFRFDGSDLMPGEIGTNAFWKAMVDFTTGEGAKTVADRVETRWKSIK